MLVVVTGGLGFIGSRLCARLLEAGAGVRCVDNLSGCYACSTGPAAIAPLEALGAEVRVADARAVHVAGADAVVHLAAIPGVRTRRSPAALHEANVGLTGRLARAAAASGARFVLASSSSVYGDARLLPTPEDAPLAPLNPYAASKVAAEAAARRHGGDAVIVRPFTVYGPGQRPEMAFARWIDSIERGRPVLWHAAEGAARDFTYVDDAVAGLVAALHHGHAGCAYNVSGGRAVPLREPLDLLGEALGGAGPADLLEEAPRRTEARVTSGCGRRSAAELGYEPSVALAEGLDRQVAAASPARLAA